MKTTREVLIVDIEATCWDKDEEKRLNTSEIIEYGYAILNLDSGEITSNNSVYVLPVVSTVSKFCTDLTGITPELVDSVGISFAELCQFIKKDHSKYNWLSYGDYDRVQFQRQCERLSIKYPFGRTHFNIKTLYALMYGLDKEVGMMDCLKGLNLEHQGRHHSGRDDALNIAHIVREILCG